MKRLEPGGVWGGGAAEGDSGQNTCFRKSVKGSNAYTCLVAGEKRGGTGFAREKMERGERGKKVDDMGNGMGAEAGGKALCLGGKRER